MSAGKPDRAHVFHQMQHLTKQLNQILAALRECLRNSDNFKSFLDVDFKERHRYRATLAYSECFSSLAVCSRSEMDDIVDQYWRNEDVRDVYEELVSREEEWDEFVREIKVKFHDEILRSSNTEAPKVLTDSQLALEVVDVETKSSIALKDVIGSSRYTLLAFFRQTG